MRPVIEADGFVQDPRADQASPPADLVQEWETAYRRYGLVSDQAPHTPGGDPGAMRQMAVTSREVAAAWRRIAAVTPLSWWTLAAVQSAAQAFESQTRDLEDRADRLESPVGDGADRAY